MTSERTIPGLYRLARAYRVQTAYRGVDGPFRYASPEGLLALLRALGAHVSSRRDVIAALQAREQETWTRVIEPVILAWGGRLSRVLLHLPVRAMGRPLGFELRLETGETRNWQIAASDLRTVEGYEAAPEGYMAVRTMSIGGLPHGYHRLSVEFAGGRGEALVISAPRRAFSNGRREWGAFLPLYALHSGDGSVNPDFSGLGELVRWTAAQGGDAVATMPLLAAFLDEPFEASPYSPVSRLFWNEFYIDPAQAPGFIPASERAPAFRRGLTASEQAPAFRPGYWLAGDPGLKAGASMSGISSDRAGAPEDPLLPEWTQPSGAGSRLTDYRGGMAAKRAVLEAQSAAAFGDAAARAQLDAYRAEDPLIEDYARFRATLERQRSPWRTWPSRQREGVLQDGDFDPMVRDYHLYVQWLAERQLAAVAAAGQESGARLYMDMPLGVNGDGFDVWRFRELFAEGVSVGAPPDAFSTLGQDWGFPPLLPDALRREGHGYFIRAVRQQLRHAGYLRIDHVLGFHRMFWVPRGLGAANGVYVRYPAEEMYAIVCLESHRYQVRIAGEDLGVVPAYVRPAMKRHGLLRSYVAQFEVDPNRHPPLLPPPADSVASLNTHDLVPFAALHGGLDIVARVERAELDAEMANHERDWRDYCMTRAAEYLEAEGFLQPGARDTASVSAAWIEYLAASPAVMVLVNLEDLWQETEPQNIPGTTDGQHPNWRRRTRLAFEEWSSRPDVAEVLARVDRRRTPG